MTKDFYEVWTTFTASGRPDMLKFQGTKQDCLEYKLARFNDKSDYNDYCLVHEDDIIQDADGFLHFR